MADSKPAVLHVAGSSLVLEPSARVRANVELAVARLLPPPRVAHAR